MRLPLLRRDAPQGAGESRMRARIDRAMLHLRARRILAEVVLALPASRRPDRSRRQAAAAVGTDIREHAVHAGRAEGALVAADSRIERIRRQRLVAVLAGGSQLEHVTATIAQTARG